MSARSSQHCDPAKLRMLLRGDERCPEFREAAAHLETCEHCQTRLSELAAKGSSWREVAVFLAESGPDGAPQYSHSSPNTAASCIEDLRRLEFLAPPSHPETLGRVGRYEVQRVIGSGGMGVVLLAHDMELNRPVALKLLPPQLASSGPARHRFAREARAAAAIMHENVVAIHDVVSHERNPYLVMQYVPGQSLQDRVTGDGPLDPAQVLRIGIQAASGLAAAHAQGVVHRDIKPSNILLENDVERALLTDFGLARAVDDASVTRTGIVAGTPHFMSPEQATGREIGFQSDLFSFGATLYFAATGRPPFRAEAPVAVLKRICHDRHRPVWDANAEIPFELSDFIDRLLEKNPKKRPASATAVAEVFSRLLVKVQSPQNPIHRRLRQASRNHLVQAAAVLSACATMVIVLLVLFGSKQIEPMNSIDPAPGRATEFPLPIPPEYATSGVGSVLDTGVSPPSEFWTLLEKTRNEMDALERSFDAPVPPARLE